MYKLILLIFLTSCDNSFGWSIGLGVCPKIKVLDSFDMSQFTGTWFYTNIYPDKILGIGAQCASITLTWSITATPSNNVDYNNNEGAVPVPTGNEISLFSKFVSFGKEKKLLGSATIVSTGVLGATFPALSNGNQYYNILDTDYSNYALMFSCNNYYGMANGQNVWILSRRRSLEPQYMTIVLDLMNRNGLSRGLLGEVAQNCNNPYAYSK